MLCYITTRNVTPALQSYGGIVLQRFEFVKFVWEGNGFAGKVNYSYILWIKSTYPVAVSNAISATYRFVETHKTISRRNRVRSACEAGKQQRIQHGNRVSRFYSQNIRIIDFSSKAVAFPYKLYKFKPL